MTNATRNPSKVITAIKWGLTTAAVLSVIVSFRAYSYGGTMFALAYSLVWISLSLVCASLLFKSELWQGLIASASIALVLVGVYKFPPWDTVPRDPKIAHTFTANGYNVTLTREDSCYWTNGESGQSYLCDVTVEKRPTEKPTAPEQDQAVETAPASTPAADEAAAPDSAG